MPKINKIEQTWHRYQGPAAYSIDIDHIYDKHHPQGKDARNKECKKDLFPDWMNKNEIQHCVSRAWKAGRKKIETQADFDTRVRYRATDPKTRMTLEIWYHLSQRTILTAYPIHYT